MKYYRAVNQDKKGILQNPEENQKLENLVRKIVLEAHPDIKDFSTYFANKVTKDGETYFGCFADIEEGV